MNIYIENERSSSYEVTNFLTTRNERVEIIAQVLDQLTIRIVGWKPEPVLRIISQEYLDNALASGSLRIDAEATSEAKRRERSSRVTDDWFRPKSAKERPRKPTFTGERPARRSHSSAEFAAILNEI